MIKKGNLSLQQNKDDNKQKIRKNASAAGGGGEVDESLKIRQNIKGILEQTWFSLLFQFNRAVNKS